RARASLSRGHLSRPACSHVKQLAKRPGTHRTPGGAFPAGLFVGQRRSSMSASMKKDYRPDTQLVHAGILPSRLGETSESVVPTQGYVYDTSLGAERRFKNEE